MNFDRIVKLFKSEQKCSGCKFLYAEGLGFSNDQRTGTRLSCALSSQATLPLDISLSHLIDDTTKNLSACDRYARGKFVSLDVVGLEGAAAYSGDSEQIDAITNHSKRPREGQPQSWAQVNLIHLRAGK